MANLSGRVALVTGGSRGIGRAIVCALAERGADVAIGYARATDAAATAVAEAREHGVDADAFKVDLADPARVAALVQDVCARFGRLDILVNNAGVFDSVLIEDADDASFERVMAINVRAVFVACREAARRMGDDGRIINIGSILGERVPDPGLTLYAMSKFAVAGLSRALARDLGDRNITVNCVQPGPIDTDMNPADGAYADEQRRYVALKRYGRPEEVAATVAFLAGDDAAFLTGATINVDGGHIA
jgi:NAD(P)-dependent dehydrogenase (short-subunit alcohol dehydrogenase family)